MKKKFIFVCLLLIIGIIPIFSEIPHIPDKYIIFEKANNGYELYIKKLPEISSVLLTDSEKDPEMKMTNYALRTEKFHPCNGNEIRILDGKILQTKYDLFSLVDSTPEEHHKLGLAFRFFLPETVIYGYDWARKGELNIKPGININIRKFKKKYANYTSIFEDQEITLMLYYDERDFRPNVIEEFTELAEITDGNNIIRNRDDDLSEILEDFIPMNVPEGEDADVIFIIDATLSMKEEIPVFQNQYLIIKRELQEKVSRLRIALIFYRDYGEMFLTKVYDFNPDVNYTDYLIRQIKIEGGEDIPEAVYEALVELKDLNFTSSNRIAFLVGDAPPHQTPRGKITRDDAIDSLKETKVKLHTISLPYR